MFPHFCIIIFAICLFYNMITNPYPSLKVLAILTFGFIAIVLYMMEYNKRTSS
jgi:hypothetical protein